MSTPGSYQLREYPAIVRDLLTTLTGGTTAERLPAPPAGEAVVLTRLADRPVRRVSHVEGWISTGDGPDDVAPYRFTGADYELFAADGNPEHLDSLRFRDGGRRPQPGTELTVNYYPVQTPPVPLTDVSVGSVVRTLLETIGRELAMAHLQLQHVYDSAFLDTAEGPALDQVVALVGVQRMKPGHPLAGLRFTRREGVPGRITVPANTAVTDADGRRYLTTLAVTLEPYEAQQTVQARAERPATPPAEANTLSRLETLIAGIAAVTNPEPGFLLNAPETDDALRRRARNALRGNVRGTVEAIEFGVRAIDGVREVVVVEAPDGVPGELRVDVAATDEALKLVRRRVEELRPAGIRVRLGVPSERAVRVAATLTLAGSGVPDADKPALLTAAQARLADALAQVSPGGTVRRARLLAALLQDTRVADATVGLTPDGGPAVEELTLAEGEVLKVTGYDVTAPLTEDAPAPLGPSSVQVALPLTLLPGITAAEAEAALGLAIDSHLTTRGPDQPLTVDALVAAARDDTRYVIVRAEVVITVETADGRFEQLADGSGSYTPAAGETLTRAGLTLDVREGG